ncbi:MAG TPA: hypothetical protein VHU84_13735 [Lacipirellulaceae bacterium]|jgi:hypothetical protein|nr:hypothetical protein [Lacipirellulaceae bacterium]
MNENDECLPEEVITDSLAPLREMSVPEEIGVANRAAIARALARHTRRPWWQRTVAVPVPVALAATLAIFAASIALVAPVLNRREVERTAVRLTTNQIVEPEKMRDVGSGESVSSTWTVTRSYLQSIESLATPRVPVDFEIKENRNDS